MGAVQGKVTTADLAANMQLWAHMGHPCGESFMGEKFYKAHPEYQWQEKYLTNMLHIRGRFLQRRNNLFS
jgi:hypothetical protein